VAGAAITFYVVNTLTVATAVGLQLGMSPFAVWKANWRDDIAEYSALLLLGLLTTLIVSVYPWSIVLVALPTSIVYTSLKNGLNFRLKAKEVTEEKKKVETLLNETFGGIIELDADLRIRVMNPAAEAITGYSLNEVFRKTLPEVWGQDACKEGSALRRAIETGQRIPPEEAK
jgi:PAS domain-containing protein